MTGNGQLPKDIVQGRLEETASGYYIPHVPGLPDLIFVKMGPREKGKTSREYSAKLKELLLDGGYFSRSLIPAILERQCRENGIDPNAPAKLRKASERIYKNIPEEFKEPIDKLTDDEAARVLTPEEFEARKQLIQERGRKMMEYINGSYTDEEKQAQKDVQQIENLERHLINNSAEFLAERHRTYMELLLCCRKEGDPDEPYFETIEEIMELEDKIGLEPAILLLGRWQAWKKGLDPDYFRPNNTGKPGVGSDLQSSGGEHS